MSVRVHRADAADTGDPLVVTPLHPGHSFSTYRAIWAIHFEFSYCSSPIYAVRKESLGWNRIIASVVA